MNAEPKFVSVVVPVYNESATVKSTLEQIKEVLQEYSKEDLSLKYEIIAVDDCSRDTSREIIEGIKGVTCLHHVVNKGYSSSLKTGIKSARGSHILILDADGTYPVKEIPLLLRHLDKFDMVVGARTGEKVHIPLPRRPAKWFLAKVANYIVEKKIPDLNSGMRVFRKELALEFWKLLPERFSFTITITMASLTSGYDVKYVPINYYSRKSKSTIHPIKDFLGFNKILLKMMLFFRPLKIFVPLSIITIISGIALFLFGWFYWHRIFDTTLAIIVVAGVQFFILGLVAELIVRGRG